MSALTQNRSDNRWKNIRVVDNKEHNKNIAKRLDNTSGVTGVSWNKRVGKWHTRITVDGEHIILGDFVKFSDAVDARKNAEVLYKFHENHGGNYERY